MRSRALLTALLAGCLALPAAEAAGKAAAPGSAIVDAARDDLATQVAALLKARSDPNARDQYGATALSWAIYHVNAPVTQGLLAAGADPNAADVNGVSPLGLAAANGARDIVRMLLAKGAKPNVAQTSGETPLMTAIRVGDADIVRMLLEAGAEVNVRETKFQQTALMWAAGHPEIVRQLLARGADVHAVTKTWDVTATIYLPITYTLGVTGIPWNNEGDYTAKAGGQNALMFAVQKHDLESAKLLVEAGVDVNAPAADGTTPLLAALYGWQAPEGRGLKFAADLPMANFLLDKGAKTNAADRAGYTPLHGAVLAMIMAQPGGPAVLAFFPNGRPRAAPVRPKPAANEEAVLALTARLLERGADPNRPTLYPTVGPVGAVRINPAPPGSTPFHIAGAAHSPRLVALMAKHRGDLNLARKDGHTPFSVAVMSNDLPVVRQMIADGADLKRLYDLTDKVADPVLPKTEERHRQGILHVAAISGSEWVIEELAARGAPTTTRNSLGETPLDLALGQEKFRYAYDLEQDFFEGIPLAAPTDTMTSDAVRRVLGKKAVTATSETARKPGA